MVALAPVTIAVMAVSVAIAIPVAVTVAIAAVELHAVEYDAYGAESAFVVERLYVGELTAVERAHADNEEREVGHAVGHGGIGDNAHGHAVGQHVVVALAQLGKELVETVSAEQFHRVGGERCPRV